jgi:hypothetical protein
LACTQYTGWRVGQTDCIQSEMCGAVRPGGKRRTNPGRRERETRRRMKFSSNNGLQTRGCDSRSSEKSARSGPGRRVCNAQRKQLVCRNERKDNRNWQGYEPPQARVRSVGTQTEHTVGEGNGEINAALSTRLRLMTLHTYG